MKKLSNTATVANMLRTKPGLKADDIVKKLKVSKVYAYNLLTQARKKMIDDLPVVEDTVTGMTPTATAELAYNLTQGRRKHRMQSSEKTIRVPEVGDSVGGLTLTRKAQGGSYLYRWVKDEAVKSGQVEVDAPEADTVNHPAHYKTGGIETIDFIEAKGLNYHLGNVVKYITRADHKGDRLENLKKAQWYLNREIGKA